MVKVWKPFPDLRVRVTRLENGDYGLEVWKRIDENTWVYKAILPYEKHEQVVREL
jgi:hypothetical protein